MFEVYLEPEDKAEQARTFREKQFANWILWGTCRNWEECERRWQALKLDERSKPRTMG